VALGRDNLPPEHGMLFIDDKENRNGIWMKDMRFAIDILWFNSRFKLVTIAQNVTPDSYPRGFYPSKNAQHVLEVPAGFVSQYYIMQGENVVVSNF
jgi:uncharacterized membrane protein (UPF0127 family)